MTREFPMNIAIAPGRRLQWGLVGSLDGWFLSRGVPRELPADMETDGRLVYAGRYTRIRHYEAMGDLVAKMAFLRSKPRDFIRRYYSSQARRETRATAIMQSLGLVTPQLMGFAVPLAPWRRWDSILFMKPLPAHDTLRMFLRLCEDAAQRRDILTEVGTGVARIYAAGYHHKDCHLENVLRSRQGRLIWIDHDLRYTRRREVQIPRLISSLDQLLDTSPDFIQPAEWRLLGNVIEHGMARSPWAQAVCRPALRHFRQRLAREVGG